MISSQPEREEAFQQARSAYFALGTGLLRAGDIATLEQLQFRIEASAAANSATADYYAGWIDAELGLAKQTTEPQAAEEHLERAIGSLRAAEEICQKPARKIEFAVDGLLLSVMRERIAKRERPASLHRTAVGHLGALMRDAVALVEHEVPTPNAPHTAYSVMAEIGLAGTLLAMARDNIGNVPVPSSPRQRKPSRSVDLTGDTASRFIIYRYARGNSQPEWIIPTRIILSSKNRPQRPPKGIAIYNAKRDLLCQDWSSFSKLGKEFREFSSDEKVGYKLSYSRKAVADILKNYRKTPSVS